IVDILAIDAPDGEIRGGRYPFRRVPRGWGGWIVTDADKEEMITSGRLSRYDAELQHYDSTIVFEGALWTSSSLGQNDEEVHNAFTGTLAGVIPEDHPNRDDILKKRGDELSKFLRTARTPV